MFGASSEDVLEDPELVPLEPVPLELVLLESVLLEPVLLDRLLKALTARLASSLLFDSLDVLLDSAEVVSLDDMVTIGLFVFFIANLTVDILNSF
jgi:hypothetical protein